ASASAGTLDPGNKCRDDRRILRTVSISGGKARGRGHGSERTRRSSEQREGFGRGVAVIMLLPRALDGNDHPLGRVHVDVLAEGANRHEGAAVDAGWSVRQ